MITVTLDEIKSSHKDGTNGASLFEMHFSELIDLPERSFLVDRFDFERGTLINICGTGESGKTLFAQHLALCFSSQKKIMGEWEIVPGRYRVLHIDLEQSESMTKRRYVRLAASLGISASQIHGITRKTLESKIDEKSAEETHNYLMQLFHGQDVVIIDSMRQALLCDENNSQIGSFLNRLKRAAEAANCIVFFISHMGKTDGSSKQSARGSSAIFDAVDMQLDLSATHSEDSIMIEVRCAKNRDFIRWKGFTYRLVDEGEYISSQKCTSILTLSLMQKELKKDTQMAEELILKYLQENKEMNQRQFRDVSKLKGVVADQLAKDMVQQKILTLDIRSKSNIYSIGEHGQTMLDYEVQ
jgi:RecA-family ATPase